MFTKENPGCIHDMYAHLSRLSGIPIMEEVKLPYNEVFKTNKKGKVKLAYPSYNVNYVINGRNVGWLYKQMRKGNIAVLTNGKEDFPYDVAIDHFIVHRRRNKADFGVEIEDLGKSYNDSLGNGWWSKCHLYKIGDKYFANMDCTCE